MRLKLCWFMFGGGVVCREMFRGKYILDISCEQWERRFVNGVKLVLFSIFVTHSAVNAITPNRLYPKNNLNRQKGKADHVSQPSFS